MNGPKEQIESKENDTNENNGEATIELDQPDCTDKEIEVVKETLSDEILSKNVRRLEGHKQAGLINDSDISIVRHHQRRKRTYSEC